MPRFDFTEEERAVLASIAREYVRNQRYPLAPRLAPIKAALLKLAPEDEAGQHAFEFRVAAVFS
jgi:hypothetical protein